MSERKPASGRAGPDCYPDGRLSGDYWSYCEVGPCRWTWEACLTVKEAADALRDHLRTEHADLWKRCGRCAGKGYDAWVHGPNRWTCTRCHGRGYIERSDR